MKTRPCWVPVHRYSGLAHSAAPDLSVFFNGPAVALPPYVAANNKPFKAQRPIRCTENNDPYSQTADRFADPEVRPYPGRGYSVVTEQCIY